MDYRAEDFTEVVRGADIVFDTVGDYEERSLSVLKPGGVLISSTGRGDLDFAARVEAAGIRWGALSVEPDYAALEAMTVLAEAGRLRPHVSHVLRLEEIGRAHELVETNRTRGKVVISML